MTSRYAQALEQQQRFARMLASPEGVRDFYSQGPDQVLLRRFYQSARLTLAAADPYHWVPEMCSLLQDVSAEMPPWTLRREALPTDHGFCWFEAPLSVDGRLLHVVALTWGIHRPTRPSKDDPETLVLSVWGGDMRTDRIWALFSLSWPPGTQVAAEDMDDATDTAENARIQRRIFRYGAAIFALLEQRILVASPEGISRAARRRLQKAGARRPPAILVVRLRRAVHEGDDADGHPVAWTCRWIVRGHWRQQYHPSDGSHRPLFILPHIKGPESLPLRAPAERVFAVVR